MRGVKPEIYQHDAATIVLSHETKADYYTTVTRDITTYRASKREADSRPRAEDNGKINKIQLLLWSWYYYTTFAHAILVVI